MSLSNYIIPLILFVIFANPATFKAVRGVAGNWVATADGAGNLGGLILHGLLYIFLVGFLMRRISFYGDLHPFDTKTEVHRGPQLGGDWAETKAGY
jgi:hypothetical protein